MTWEWVVLILGFAFWLWLFYLVESLRRKWGIQ